jgi:catechol 2,3-dioxygenase-like lactoylglutathione lyase family enzyme
VIRTRGLTHVALRVRDVDRALRFYAEVFGAAEVYRSEGFVQAQTPGSFDVLVFEEGLDEAAATGDIAHFGFRLVDPADIDAAAAAVEAAGGRIVNRGEFGPGEPYVFFRDPDGYEVEVWFERPTPVDPPEHRAKSSSTSGDGTP